MKPDACQANVGTVAGVERKFMNGIMLAFLGWPEIVAILAVVLLLFGAKKLPELAKGLGSGIKEFKKASRDVQDEIERSTTEEPTAPRKPEAPAHPTEPQFNKPPTSGNA